MDQKIPNFLPIEIYCLIFLYARQASLLLDPSTGNRKPIEMNISHVSRLWRTISLDFQGLWTIFSYFTPKSRQVQPADRMRAYFERSGSQPLEVWLNFTDNTIHSHLWRETHTEMFRILLAEQARWRRVTVLLRNIDHVSFDVVEVPLLEHFRVFQSIDDEADLFDWRGSHTSRFLAKAPRLTSIRLDLFSFSKFRPALSSIRTLHLDISSTGETNALSLPLEAFKSIFKLSSLKHLSLSGARVHRDDVASMEHIVAPNLEDLRVGLASTGFTTIIPAFPNISELLTKIEAPKLQSLTLKYVSFPRLGPHAFPSLRRLNILDCDFVPWNDFYGILSPLATKLEQLVLSSSLCSEETIHALTSSTFPNLRIFGCNIQSLSRIDTYLQFALELQHEDRPFIFRIHRNLGEMLEQKSPGPLALLRSLCTLQLWDSYQPLLPMQWPYTEETHVDNIYDKMDIDPFRIISYF